ncbi:MAG: hypothetical protein M3391_01000 [Actinomycetota bacterium]|nr:hypothetical protein [Actinomycetota bacterium]
MSLGSGTPRKRRFAIDDHRGSDDADQADRLTKRQRWARSLSRTFRLLVLLLVIALTVVSTTLLDRGDQIFLLKIFLVLFLSVLPGWLFLQFISVKGTGLYDEYVLNLYRLRIDDITNLPKPPPGSTYWSEWDDVVPRDVGDDAVARNIYLKKFEAAYGRGTVPESRRRRRRDDNLRIGQDRKLSERIGADAFSPIILATALFTVGWTIVVQPELARDLSIFVSLPLSGLPELPQEALRFGFLGAYAFILQNMIRRYFQMDLRNHAYVSAIARVILVAALIVAIHPIWAWTGAAEEMELAFAFFLGFFPEMGFRLLRHQLSSFVRSGETMDERYPLSDLDGLNVWCQARLMEEGIEDMQNLTTANLVDLMLYTRMPVGRITDWIDQAFLYLRVGGGLEGVETDRAKLRRLGIRTATDLIDACEAGRRHDRAFYDPFLRVLNADPSEPSAVEGLRRALEGEVNLWHIREWKKHKWLKPRRMPSNGRAKAEPVTVSVDVS